MVNSHVSQLIPGQVTITEVGTAKGFRNGGIRNEQGRCKIQDTGCIHRAGVCLFKGGRLVMVNPVQDMVVMVQEIVCWNDRVMHVQGYHHTGQAYQAGCDTRIKQR